MSSYKYVGLVAAVVAACAFVPIDRVVEAASPEPGSVSAGLRGFLESQGSPAFASDARGAELWSVLQTFYRDRDYQPAWVRGDRLTPGAQALLRAAAAAGREGLSADRYDPRLVVEQAPQVLEAAVGARGDEPLARLDVAVTYAFLRYASDLVAGSVDPRGAASLWQVSTRTFDAAALLEKAARRDAPVSVLEDVRPAHPQYAALAEALVRYRQLAAAGGWPMLPARATMKPGGRARHAAALRARLQASGDTLAGFQRRHGLRLTGIVDRETLEALNVPVEDRIRQLELNLERWRWQGWEPDGRTILVNVPTFQLHAYEDGREALTMRVITGTGDSQTPVFAEEMTQVVFSPHWNVPANILETEVLPAIRRNPGYLARQNMEMVRAEGGGVSVRQRPGPRNALGLVKFLFPNPYNVYLHDTPADALFARPRRAFSHGCVRLEKPEALARFVLKGAADWNDAQIARAMRSGREQFVALETPVPMRIAYFTAWVDADGAVLFAPDVYRHDVAQRKLVPVARPAVLVASGGGPEPSRPAAMIRRDDDRVSVLR
jgi:L,D-transpeptidase YcbB